MTELESENRLAAAILRGNIVVKETRTLMGTLVTQIGTIMIQLMLAIQIITAVEPERMTNELKMAYENIAKRTTFSQLTAKLRKWGNKKLDPTMRDEIMQELNAIRTKHEERL